MQLVEKCDAWITLTWFVAGRKEIKQLHRNCTCIRSLITGLPQPNTKQSSLHHDRLQGILQGADTHRATNSQSGEQEIFYRQRKEME